MSHKHKARLPPVLGRPSIPGAPTTWLGREYAVFARQKKIREDYSISLESLIILQAKYHLSSVGAPHGELP